MQDNQIEKQLDKLDHRCEDLDQRMRRFEDVARTAKLVAGLLGLSVVTGIIVYNWLSGKVLKVEESAVRADTRFQEIEKDLKNAHDVLQSLSETEREVQALQAEANSIRKDLASSRTKIPGVQPTTRLSPSQLVSQIKEFELTSPLPPYAWVGFRSDCQELSDFAQKYLSLSTETHAATSQGDLEAPYQELVSNATKAVADRACSGLKDADVGKPEGYKWHCEGALANFRYLLGRLREDQGNRDQGNELSKEQIKCYQDAFPGWFSTIGLPGVTPIPQSARCKELLRN